jgi:hypothetical protein
MTKSREESDEEGPYGGYLFVMDAPGRDGLPTVAPGRKRFYRDNMEEFVRVRIGGGRPSGNTLNGSRASYKFDWYSHSYIVVADGVWMRSSTFNVVAAGHDYGGPQ